MNFKNDNEILDYIEMNHIFMCEDMPCCCHCNEVIRANFARMDYYKLDLPSGFEVFCSDDCMFEYLKENYGVEEE